MTFTDSPHRRVLAIHPESRGFGYVVFESPRAIIDWGSKSIRRDKLRVTLAKAGKLFDQYVPDVLVFEDCQAAGARRSRRVVQLLANLRKLAVSKHISSCSIPKHTMRKVFTAFNAKTKEEIVYVLADKLPPLSPWLPQQKVGAGDYHRMPVFGAAALGLTYFYVRRVRSGLPKNPTSVETAVQS